MKKPLLYSFILVLFLSVWVACEKETTIEPDISFQYPVAAFSYTGNEGPSPVTIQFINHSETIIPDSCIYTWTFGEDGPQSNLKNPSHTFTHTGSDSKNFLVTLHVKDLVSNLSQARSQAILIQGAAKK